MSQKQERNEGSVRIDRRILSPPGRDFFGGVPILVIRACLLCLFFEPAALLLLLLLPKVDDYLVENIDAALGDRESGALEKTALWDDLHVTRGKAEQLEARLRRQAAEGEVSGLD